VGNHADEENGIEPGEGAPIKMVSRCLRFQARKEVNLLKSSDQTPRHGKPDVSGVVNLSCKTVPAVDENGSLGGNNRLGVVDSLPRNLGEGLAPDNSTSLHGAESVLLAVAAVPDPVPEEVADVDCCKNSSVPAVHLRGVIGQVDGAVAVRERYTGQVPEDEHETPLLVVHIPGYCQLVTVLFVDVDDILTK
jgi:hypothetical protein